VRYRATALFLATSAIKDDRPQNGRFRGSEANGLDYRAVRNMANAAAVPTKVGNGKIMNAMMAVWNCRVKQATETASLRHDMFMQKDRISRKCGKRNKTAKVRFAGFTLSHDRNPTYTVKIKTRTTATNSIIKN
jgi:hypothetical protein